MFIFTHLEIVCFIVFLAACLAEIILLVTKDKSEQRKMDDVDLKAKFAILIPARDESAVIENTLKSIEKNDYPKEYRHIFVIVESMDDPTVEIVKKFDDAGIFLRKDLTKIGKGHALDECVQNIFAKKQNFDAFVILDADNLISQNFLSLMNIAFQNGYDVACGKRDNKDWNASVVSSSSALTFTTINSVINKNKMKSGGNVLVSGTGFYIRSDVLASCGGWPFYSLTEDYEFTRFCLYHKLKTGYVEEAVFYDEQPLKLSQSVVQRSRWVRGFFSVKAKYWKQEKELLKSNRKDKNFRRQCIGSAPLFGMAFSLIFYIVLTLLFVIFGLISHHFLVKPLIMRILFVLLAAYLFGMVFTLYLFKIEKGNIDINRKNKALTVLYHPFFLLTYVVAAIRSIFIPDKWEKIEHTLNKEI